ncbi:MFS transporter [Staphylococcus simiae]|uniref:MFS transporter n=1 Tax=Staphylococcus simiae TaxID=308354 RepID=UPI001A9654BB|nr:MFS transporter [Staphylococcus simiae]MBO1199857.1 MFS transporter [Staphylococcus simiae]MBO1202230.1 MFS transporter [Staphylococcus simiae]MBO1204481.1 MFS transporter [Staphylococcus simiae]MBO1211916.1 MFS transporter [Staphylococcus simiae]MBO1230666.1 MFS transporter [Staphylococcus simiae]
MKHLRTSQYQLVVAWLTLFFVGTDLFVVSPLLPSMTEDFGISSQQASWIVTSFAIIYAVTAPIFGIIADHWGKKRNIIVGLILFAIANGITYISGSYLTILLSRIFAGGSAAMITSSVFAITGDLAPQKKNGLYLSIATSGFLTAIWVGAPIGNLIASATHWRTVFILLAISTVILSLLNSAVLPNIIKQMEQSNMNLMAFKHMVIDVAVTMFWALAVYGVYTFLGTIFKNVTGLTTVMVSIAFTFYGIGALIGSLSGGWLADKLGNDKVIKIGMTALGIVLIILSLIIKMPVLLLPMLSIWAFSGYLIFSAYQSFIAKRHAAFSGSVMAWNQTAMYVGITLGSMMGGYLINHHSSLLFVLCAISAFIGLLWYRLKVA